MGGWIAFSALMQVKHMFYPGHDVMRQCVQDSAIFEVNDNFFRLKDANQRNAWIQAVVENY